MDEKFTQNLRRHRNQTDDLSLVKAFQAGDKGAFDGLVLNHQDRIFNLCLWFVGDYQEANDVAQEVFIKAFRSLNGFKRKSIFSTWLYRIAVNTCKSRLNSLEIRIKKRTWGLNKAADENPIVDIEDPSPSPMAALEKKERSAIIKRAIQTLPKDKKSVVILRDIQGLTYEEISVITGLNLGTIKSKLARARGDLRKKLKGSI
jgi:RNA polymerase sigma-70 factor (ECF subfamily)